VSCQGRRACGCHAGHRMEDTSSRALTIPLESFSTIHTRKSGSRSAHRIRFTSSSVTAAICTFRMSAIPARRSFELIRVREDQNEYSTSASSFGMAPCCVLFKGAHRMDRSWFRSARAGQMFTPSTLSCTRTAGRRVRAKNSLYTSRKYHGVLITMVRQKRNRASLRFGSYFFESIGPNLPKIRPSTDSTFTVPWEETVSC
jgi:hypothetical protein